VSGLHGETGNELAYDRSCAMLANRDFLNDTFVGGANSVGEVRFGSDC
jgi:hypothetical protein